jgi:hypothetical protein
LLPPAPADPEAPVIVPLLIISNSEPEPQPVPDNRAAVPVDEDEIVTPELIVSCTLPEPPNPADVAIE